MVSRSGGQAGGGFVAGGGDSGNIYAGHDGNVYRRDESGNWQKHDNGGWTNTDKPAQGGGTRERPATTPQRDPTAGRHGHHWPTRIATAPRAPKAPRARATTAAYQRRWRRAAAIGRAAIAAAADGAAKAKGGLISKSPGGLEINPPRRI